MSQNIEIIEDKTDKKDKKDKKDVPLDKGYIYYYKKVNNK